MYLDSKEWLSLGLYPVTFLFLFTVKFTKDFIDSLRRLCAKIHLRIKSQCCFMLIFFRVDFSLIWRLSVLRPASRHLHSVCRVCMPAGTALAQSVVSAVAGKSPMWYPPSFNNLDFRFFVSKSGRTLHLFYSLRVFHTVSEWWPDTKHAKCFCITLAPLILMKLMFLIHFINMSDTSSNLVLGLAVVPENDIIDL